MEMFKLVFSDGPTLFFSLLILCVFIFILVCLLNMNSKFENMLSKYKTEEKRNGGESTPIVSEENVVISKNKGIPDTNWMENYQEEFEENLSNYNAASSLISLMPMLGILGTVYGLIRQVSSIGIEEITNSIGVALITTFWGMLFAIILKCIDSLLVGKRLDKVQTVINQFETQLTNMNIRSQLVKGHVNEQTK